MNTGVKIKIWMLEKGLKAQDIANGYGCNQSMVTHFIKGDRASRGLEKHLKKLGCPKEYFNNGRVAA